jgi:hypothetical protein
MVPLFHILRMVEEAGEWKSLYIAFDFIMTSFILSFAEYSRTLVR